ncbi:MAG: xanthine dehydrogenase family protein molybdopterin-binding subunit [Pseudomonadota bacterium]
MPDPVTAPIAHVRLGSNAGQPITRRDGELKVTGQAVYAADNRPQGLLYAVYASAAIARGRVAGMDVAAARAHPGVVEVMTIENVPSLAQDPDAKPTMFSWRLELLTNDRVRYAGQPIAVVIAETIEAATEGARLLAPSYETETPAMTLDAGEHFDAQKSGLAGPPRFVVGDLEAGMAAAAQVTETVVETPLQYHNAMEPHAIVAKWTGDRLEIDTPNQAPHLAAAAVADFFGIPHDNVVLRTPFIGGGFGAKAGLTSPQMLGIMAAKLVDRPVKLTLRRDQMFGPVFHRGATRQTLRLGTDADGKLTALDHHSLSSTSTFDDFLEGAASASQNTYTSPAIQTAVSGVRIDTGTPGPMRAPGEASGSAGLEVAMDEAAQAAGLDPLEFRVRNYAETDPASGRPFTSKALRECYAEGARLFGWHGRPLAPRSMRDDHSHLVGWGVGTALFAALLFPAKATATLRRSGKASVETSSIDMGQGAWTALAQLAAEGLGLNAAEIELEGGSNAQSNGGVAGGSAHTASAGSALFAAGQAAVSKLAEIAVADPASPLFGAGNEGVEAREGRLYKIDDPSRSESYVEIMQRAGVETLTGEGTSSRAASAQDMAAYAHGAVFAEVKVDPELFQVRVSRLIGVFAAGRIVNPRLARSQLLGGMIWSVGFALHEEGLHDLRTGRPVGGDLAGYHVPVNADAPMIEAHFVDEDDPHVNPLGIKGVGELGITGSTGAIANAIWHATGHRPRRFPVHIADLLDSA